MNKRRCLLFSALGMFAFLCIWMEANEFKEKQQLVLINEVCSSNMRIIKDGVHDGSDYIELYNPTEEVICMEGWWISDNKSEICQHSLPECYINPGEYVVLYSKGTEGDILLPFGINYEGETLFLSDASGELIDNVYVPRLSVDVSYARNTDGADTWEIKEPTPGQNNMLGEKIVSAVLEEPEFSAETGFYEESFYLTLEAGWGERIYYTLDGSTPNENSFVYKEPILIENISNKENRYVSLLKVTEEYHNYEPDMTPVDKATVVRAIAVNFWGETSEVATETFFVDLPEYKEKTVISLVAEPEELFGAEGIFATGTDYDFWYENGKPGEKPEPNFMKRGKAWEVPAQMHMFEQGEVTIDQIVGMRTQGNSGRVMPLKRLSLFAREEYSGSDYFDSALLGKEQVHSVMLNEFVSNAALPRLVEDREVGIQKSRVEPVAVFINGEYWYTKYIMEKYNRYYLAETYGVDPENVILFKNNEVHTGETEDKKYFKEVRKIAKDENLTPDEKYDLLSEKIDMQSFIDFFCINAYLCNMNMNERENYVLWRTAEPEDGEYGDTKWRWLIYDIECLESLNLEYYGVSERAEINSFDTRMDWTYTRMNEISIFEGLKDCERFREQFISSFLEIANNNFAYEKVESLLSEYGLTMEWLEGFFLKRKECMIVYMAREFSVSETMIREMQ